MSNSDCLMKNMGVYCSLFLCCVFVLFVFILCLVKLVDVVYISVIS
jgi:hypothetical protein